MMMHILAAMGVSALIGLVVSGVTNGIARERQEPVPNFAMTIIAVLCGTIGALILVAATGGF